MRNILFVFAFFLGCLSLSAQFVSDNTLSMEDLIQQKFLGASSVSISNVNLVSGGNAQYGFFTNSGTSLPISEGIVFSTGDIGEISDDGVVESSGSPFGACGGSCVSTDLDGLVTAGVHDLVEVTFEFTAQSDKVFFEYIFASEEYPDYIGQKYTCSSFNDVFAFYVEGVTTPLLKKNVALIPGTTTPVSINSINEDECGNDNADLFINNNVGSGFVFDGHTTLLSVEVDVIPCETYKFTLAIADDTDESFNSAVFLKANSFSAAPLTITPNDVPLGVEDEGVFVEGCHSNASLSFSLPEPTAIAVSYPIEVIGTSTEGVDFVDLPDEISFAIGEQEKVIDLSILNDGISEGTETIDIIVDLSIICDGLTDTFNFTIDDGPLAELVLEDVDCSILSGTISADNSQTATSDRTYTWSTGDVSTTSPFLEVTSSGVYTVTVLDNVTECTSLVSLDVELTCDVQCELEVPYLTCENDQVVIDATITPFVDGNETFVWAGPEGGASSEDLQVSTVGVYTLTVTSSLLNTTSICSIEVEEDLGVPLFDLESTLDDLDCLDSLSTISVENLVKQSMSTAVLPQYNYAWDTGSSVSEIDVKPLLDTYYTVTVTDNSNGCQSTSSVIIGVDKVAPILTLSTNRDTINCSTPDALISSAVNTGVSYKWSTGQISSTLTADTEGIYILTVTSSINSCTSSAEQLIVDESNYPDVLLASDTLVLTCEDLTSTISLETSFSDVDIAWSTGAVGVEEIQINTPNAYIVSVTDVASGCQSTSDIIISQDVAAPMVDIVPNIETLNCIDTVSILAANSSLITLDYAWSTAETASIIAVKGPGVYTVTLTNTVNGCSASNTTEIFQEIDAPDVAVSSDITYINCEDTEAVVTVSSLTTPVDYLWSSGQVVDEFTTVDSGLYVVTVTNTLNQCTSTSAVQLTKNVDIPQVDIFPSRVVVDCANPESILTSGNNAVLPTFEWSNGAVSEDITVGSANVYVLTVTDLNNQCEGVNQVDIQESFTPPMFVLDQTEDTLTCFVKESVLYVEKEPTHQVLWFNGEVTDSVEVAIPAIYSVVVTNPSNSCTSLQEIEVFENIEEPEVDITSSALELTCAIDEIELTANTVVPVSYYWPSVDSTTQKIETFYPSIFTVVVTDLVTGCTSSDEHIVGENPEVPTLDISTSAEVLNCFNDTLGVLSADVTNKPLSQITYSWSEGATSSTINVKDAEVYSVTVTNSLDGCTNSSLIQLSIDTIAPMVTAIPTFNAITCYDTIGIINTEVDPEEVTYLWSTGATSESIVFDTPDLYEIIVQSISNGCEDLDSVLIVDDNEPPHFTLIGDSVSCNVDNFGSHSDGKLIVVPQDLSLDNLYYAYWTKQSAVDSVFYGYADSILPNRSIGNYSAWVTNVDNGCKAYAATTIFEPQSFEVSMDVVGAPNEAGVDFIYWGGQFGLTTDVAPLNKSLETYVWTASNGLKMKSNKDQTALSPTQSASYMVEAFDAKGCSDTATVYVAVKKDENVFIPNVFTPNLDGVNDTWGVHTGVGVVAVNSLQVYSRWGELVYELTGELTEGALNIAGDWDGTFKDEPLNSGVYVYVVEVQFLDGTIKQYKGDVTLLK